GGRAGGRGTRGAGWARCAWGVVACPATGVAKPHGGRGASRSASMNEPASASRAWTCSSGSTRGVLVVTRPSTATLSSGTSRSGSKVPERSSSYSSSSRSACTPPNTRAAIASYPPATPHAPGPAAPRPPAELVAAARVEADRGRAPGVDPRVAQLDPIPQPAFQRPAPLLVERAPARVDQQRVMPAGARADSGVGPGARVPV